MNQSYYPQRGNAYVSVDTPGCVYPRGCVDHTSMHRHDSEVAELATELDSQLSSEYAICPHTGQLVTMRPYHVPAGSRWQIDYETISYTGGSRTMYHGGSHWYVDETGRVFRDGSLVIDEAAEEVLALMPAIE